MPKAYGFAKVNAGARGHKRDLRVLWALEEMQLPFELVGMNHPAQELSTDAYRQPSPSEGEPGISVFYKGNAGEIFHTYSTYARETEAMMGTYNLLDLTPKGRDEHGLSFTTEWLSHHDRYEQTPHI